MQDKNITCKVCSETFVFTANEQEFYKEKGLTNDPQKCPSCRQAAKQSRGPRNDRVFDSPKLEMFPAVCSECGKSTMVPFKPSLDKPVFCSDCFRPNHR